MLEEGYLLLEFLGEVREAVRRHNILLFIGTDGLSLVIIELRTVSLRDHLRRVVEEDAS